MEQQRRSQGVGGRPSQGGGRGQRGPQQFSGRPSFERRGQAGPNERDRERERGGQPVQDRRGQAAAAAQSAGSKMEQRNVANLSRIMAQTGTGQVTLGPPRWGQQKQAQSQDGTGARSYAGAIRRDSQLSAQRDSSRSEPQPDSLDWNQSLLLE